MLSSSAIRVATLRAANRLGWVWAIMPFTPRPNSKHILGSCVVLPDPVSPATITTWLFAIASLISSFLSLTGSGGYSTLGRLSLRHLRFSIDALMSPSSFSNCAFKLSSLTAMSRFEALGLAAFFSAPFPSTPDLSFTFCASCVMRRFKRNLSALKQSSSLL